MKSLIIPDIKDLKQIPYKTKQREIGYYKRDDEIIYWNGTELQCKHKKRKTRCLECGGASICEHGQLKERCIECGGSSMCEHGKRRDSCKECGKSYCEHGTRRNICKKCEGSQICSHNIIRSTCKICSPDTYLVNIMRRRVRHALDGKEKSKHTMEYVGCTQEELRNYLESKFTKGMNWENQGIWHIDHIRPCSSFNLDDENERIMCFHYTNLQPLWGKDNLIKSTKYDVNLDTRKWDGLKWI